MAYDPAYSEPADWDNEVVSDTKLNQMKDNTHHNYKYKPECGPDTPFLKLARVKVDATITIGNSSAGGSVVFASDCLDGDPSFANAPVVVATAEVVSGQYITPDGAQVDVANVTADGFDWSVSANLVTIPSPADLVLKLHFVIIGD